MMTKQRSKFLTFIFSLAPGCGQMYMGFMKRGVSLLSIFACIIMAAFFLAAELLIVPALVVWCWAFFDALNLRALEPEQFALIEDDFVLFGKNSEYPTLHFDLPKHKIVRLFGWLLVLAGVLQIWSMTFWSLYNRFYDLNPYVAEILYALYNKAPRLLLSVVIIVIGVRLIRRQKDAVNPVQEVPTDVE